MRTLAIIFYILGGLVLAYTGLESGEILLRGMEIDGTFMFGQFMVILFNFALGVLFDFFSTTSRYKKPIRKKILRGSLRTLSAVFYIFTGATLYNFITISTIDVGVAYHVGASIPIMFSFGLAWLFGKFSIAPDKPQPVMEAVQLDQVPEIKTKAVQESDENIRFF